MIQQNNFQHRFASKFAVILSCVALAAITTASAIAHEVKTSNEVGGTIHIEPNDRPIAGKKSRIWIALTKRGGEIIPYEKCDCRLEVRSLTNKSIKFAVPKSASILDRYLGLPSIEVTFPEVGRYELRLSGSAKGDVDFPDFDLTFSTNVSK
jgi:hypothetical protein